LRRLVLIAVIAAGVAFLILSLRVVSTNEIALVRHDGELETRGPGIHFSLPFSFFKVYRLVETHTLAGSEALRLNLGGGTQVVCDCNLTLKYAPERIADLEQSYGGEIWAQLVLPLLKREIRTAVEKGGDIEKIDLVETSSAIGERLAEELKALGIALEDLSVNSLHMVSRLPPGLEPGDGVKVFVLGLDAFDWLIVGKVSQRYELENIERIRRDGAWGNLRSMEPLISPLIWTTMATGVTPDVHGITDFLIRDEATGEDVPITSTMRRVPAIWNMASLAGLSSGIVGWFATYPAETVNGFIVSDRFAHHMFDPSWKMGHKHSAVPGLTFPDTLYAEIESLYVEPEDIYDELRSFIRGDLGKLKAVYDPDDPVSSLRVALSSFKTYKRVMEYLYPKYRPNLFAIYFSFTDDVGHLFMRYMDPPMDGVTPAEAERYGDAIYQTYLEADRLIGEVLEMLDDDTVLLIVSDHGFKSGDMRPLSDSRMGFGQAPDWHRINGTIALYGGIIRQNFKIANASVMDVAPTVMYLLGLPVDAKMKGRVLTEAIDPGYLKQHPVRLSGAYDSLLVRSQTPVSPAQTDEALKAKLVSLGYVAGGSGSLVNLANFYHRSGQFTKAIDVWQKLLEENPNDLGALIGMSNAYFELGKIEEAIDGLTETLRRDPHNLEAIRSLATIYLRTGRPRDALALAERGIAIDPRDGQSYFNKASALQLMGRDREAIEQYLLAIRYSPDLAEAYANLAQIYSDHGRKDEALEMAHRALELGSGKAEMHYVMGKVLDRCGERDQALASYRTAAYLDSQFVLAYIGAGSIMLARSKVDSAILLATKAIAIESPYRPYAYDMRGTAYFLKGNIAQAKQDYLRAIEVDSRYLPARLNLAKVYLNEGKRKEATQELEAVLAIDPDNAEARSLLSSLGR